MKMAAAGGVLGHRYVVESLIGEGGMGCVFRGTDMRLGRPVAIKFLRRDLDVSSEARQRFQREAMVASGLSHPNIVGVLDFDVLPSGECFFVMELLEGETLGARLKREGRLLWAEALQIQRGILLGLGHAHDRGTIHRDIKPDNIYLTREDGGCGIKLFDFGIARQPASCLEDHALTRPGTVIGSPAYMSPEQARGHAITPASDLYSASVVLYEMITGCRPFEDQGLVAMLKSLMTRSPLPVSAAAPDVELPLGLEVIIQMGLAKDAAARIRSAQEYIDLLDRVIALTRRYRRSPPQGG